MPKQVPEGQSVSDLRESPQGKLFLILFTQNPREKALKRSLEEAHVAILAGLHFHKSFYIWLILNHLKITKYY